MRHPFSAPPLAMLAALAWYTPAITGSALAAYEEIPPAKKAVAPLAPSVPDELVFKLQAGEYAAAAAQLETLAADPKLSDPDRAYLTLVRGTALRLGQKLDDARTLLTAAIAKAPTGPWAAKLRSELVAVELAAGKFPAAEVVARAEAERLLDGTRKDRLATVFRDFAKRLLEPEQPTLPADPEGAYAMLSQARDLAQGPELRAELLKSMGQASLKAGNPGRAIENFQLYLKENPKGQGTDRIDARNLLAEAQLAAGQPLPARLTWTDLARELETVDTPEGQAVRARALFQISRTYGFPTPGDDTSLNLGTAALERLRKAYPASPLAFQAAYDIAAAQLARGKSEAALAAFRTLVAEKPAGAKTPEAAAEQARLQMAAQFQIGQILQGQQKFNEATEAFKTYLAQYPNGPQSADAQRAIVDTQLLVAQDAQVRKAYDEARAAWRTFVESNPLDGRVPQILFETAESFATQKRFDEAIGGWETLAGKFPGTEPAAHAQFLVAEIFEVEKGQLAEAIDRFKKVGVEPWAGQARQRIAVMEAKALAVITPRAFRTGETPQLKISTRNIETLTFTAYKLDPEAYFRKKHAVSNVEALDIGLVQPDLEWTAEVPGYDKYKPIETRYDLPKLEVPGVYVVKVTDEKHFQATTLVLASNVDAVMKGSREQLLVFAQDMKTGEGLAGARVLVSDGQKVILDAKTGPDGVLLQKWDEPRAPGSGLQYLVLNGAHAAGSGLAISPRVAQGLSPRAYIYTDRPAYRPGDTVELRGVVREVEESQYSSPAGLEYKLEVYDARGRQFLARPVTLSEFGTFAATVQLDSATPVGAYRVRLHRPGKSDFSGGFEVQQYQLQKIGLEIELPRTVYFRGETISGKAVAKYQYGTPLAGRDIEIGLPDGRTVRGKTDDAGAFGFEFATEGLAEEQVLGIVAALPQDGVSTRAQASLAIRAFRIALRTSRDVYIDGESFGLDVTSTDALGEPTGQELKLAILKRVEQAGRQVERQVKAMPVTTDPKTGQVRVPLSIEDDKGGTYVLRASGTDRFGNPIVEDRLVTVSGKEDGEKLRLLADRTTFKVGEQATVNLHSRLQPGRALLTWEADRILQYKLVPVQPGDNPLAWPVEPGQFPNFTLTVARMHETGFHKAQLDVRVERDLRVELTPAKPAVGPGEAVEVKVKATDQLGRPVAAELSVALVDKALLRLYGDRLPAIGPFFYDQARTGAFSTESTNTFRYQPPTQPVAEALVEEMEMSELREADRKSLEVEQLGLKQDAFRAELAASPMAPPMSMPAGMTVGGGGLGGGMGGLNAAVDAMDASDAPAEGVEEGQAGEKSKNAMMGRSLAKSLSRARGGKAGMGGRRAGGGEPMAEPSPREQFVETAYWNPSVKTAADGTATVTVTAPSALSEYRFTARGVSAADTLVGQATADLAVRKDFFADLKLPASLTEGDKTRFRVQLHHRGVPAGQAQVALVLYASGRETRLPKTVKFQGDGIEEIAFEPFEVPVTDTLRIELEAIAGDVTDKVVTRVPVRPWGVQAFATASGTASDDTTAFVSLPPGRPYESPEMLISLAPSPRRMLIELALGQEAYPIALRASRCIPLPPRTTADHASELLGAAAVLHYLREAGGLAAPEAGRLADRVRSGVADLITSQNEDGGWPWVAADPGKGLASDRSTSALALWALAEAEKLGLATDTGLLDKASAFLESQYAQIDASDTDTRAAVLHALATRHRATFELANGLNRQRQDLSDAALAHLALAFVELERPTLAVEVLGVLGPRAKTEVAAPGGRPRFYWDGGRRNPFNRTPAEATALTTLAYARALPADEHTAGAVDWLQAHRIGNGWQPHKAKGPALAALAAYQGKAEPATSKYTLAVTVNDHEAMRFEVDGNAESRVISVPLTHLNPAAPNRVHFDFEGRGSYGYAVTLTGFARDFKPDQDRNGKPFGVHRRVYWAPQPELDGKPLPAGFSVAVNPQVYENTATQLALGGKITVSLEGWRDQPAGQPVWERDALVLEEHLPAGAQIVEGSINSSASSYETGAGMIRFYFSPDQWPNATYELHGYLPGGYRALPPALRSVYEPGRVHLGPEGTLTILDAGEPSTDSYKPTPDELYHRGKGLFDLGRVAESAAPLEALWGSYTLRDDIAKDAARMLLTASIQTYNPGKVVKYFEILKEKSPELVIPFADIKVVGRAYADIGEHERAYLVWRATAEASYLEDARVGAVLRQRGKSLEGLATLLDLWRDYPSTAAIRNDFFGLASLMGGLASEAGTDPSLRRQLADASVSRMELYAQQIRLIRMFLSLSPSDPVADEASLALVGAYLDLEEYPRVVTQAERYATLYPKSKFADSFVYTQALGQFHLGKYDEAIGLADRIAKAVYKDAAGVDQPSPNKWQALYILGQIHDARHQPAEAVGYYRQVADRFTDAAGGVAELTRAELKLPEVAVVRPGAQAGVGLRSIPAAVAEVAAKTEPEAATASQVDLKFRNLTDVDVKVYAVDLMRLYLTRRNLDAIAGIDLAGIRPLLEKSIPLGGGKPFAEGAEAIDLPLEKEGAYLVMARGGNLYTSGIVLVSPLELEVLEEVDAGRVRVRVRDAVTGAYVPKAQVKVIGSDNPKFISGETDLRGVMVAEGVRGTATVVARKGTAQYAFHRGKTYLGQQAQQVPQKPGDGQTADKPQESPQSLEFNIRQQNDFNREGQRRRLESRYNAAPGGQGVQVDQAR